MAILTQSRLITPTAFLVLLIAWTQTTTAADTSKTIIGLDLGIPSESLDTGIRLLTSVLTNAGQDEHFGLVIADQLVQTVIDPIPAKELLDTVSNLSLEASDSSNFSALVERSLAMGDDPNIKATQLWIVSGGEIELSSTEDSTAKIDRYQMWASDILLPDIASRYTSFRLISPQQNNPAIVDAVVNLFGEKGHQVLPNADSDLDAFVDSLTSEELIVAAIDSELPERSIEKAPDVTDDPQINQPETATLVNTQTTGMSENLALGSSNGTVDTASVMTELLTEQTTIESPTGNLNSDAIELDLTITTTSEVVIESEQSSVALTDLKQNAESESDNSLTVESQQPIVMTAENTPSDISTKPDEPIIQIAAIDNSIEDTEKSDNQPTLNDLDIVDQSNSTLVAKNSTVDVESANTTIVEDNSESATTLVLDDTQAPEPTSDQSTTDNAPYSEIIPEAPSAEPQIASIDESPNTTTQDNSTETEIATPEVTTSSSPAIDLVAVDSNTEEAGLNQNWLMIVIAVLAAIVTLLLAIMFALRKRTTGKPEDNKGAAALKASQQPETIVMSPQAQETIVMAPPAASDNVQSAQEPETIVMAPLAESNSANTPPPALEETIVNPPEESTDAPQRNVAEDFSAFDRSIIEKRQAKRADKKLEPSDDS